MWISPKGQFKWIKSKFLTLFKRLTTSGEIDCACVQKHSTDMKILAIGRGVIEELPDTLKKLNVKRPMIVSGPVAFSAVGRRSKS